MPFKYNPLSENAVTHNTKIKVYPDGSTEITYCKSAIFRDKSAEARPKGHIIEECHIKPEKEVDELTSSRDINRDRTAEYLRIHKDKVRDIVLMNEFTHFLTITINPEQLDSFDVEAVNKLQNIIYKRVTVYATAFMILGYQDIFQAFALLHII